MILKSRPIPIRKGKYASTTENRRLVWEHVVWPLILDNDDTHFTLNEYHFKRNKVCRVKNISQSKIAGGIVSLLTKGVLIREGKIYSIHYKLVPYMRKRAYLSYGSVLKEISSKK